MKKLTLIAGLFMGLMFTSCEKEENSPISSNNTEMSSSKGALASNNKSGESEMEALAKAANVQEISYSNGVYTVYFHNSTETYDVTINSFDYEGIIDFDVEKASGSTANVLIDSVSQTITIEDDGTYSFAAFEDFEITPTNDVVFNLTPIISIYHALTPNTSATFTHNGDDDVFPGGGGNDKFWGRGPGVPGPCVDNVVTVTYTYYVFWIGFPGGSSPNLC